MRTKRFQFNLPKFFAAAKAIYTIGVLKCIPKQSWIPGWYIKRKLTLKILFFFNVIPVTRAKVVKTQTELGTSTCHILLLTLSTLHQITIILELQFKLRVRFYIFSAALKDLDS